MRIELVYPLLLRCTVAQRRGTKTGIFLKKVQLGITELSDDDAPVILSMKNSAREVTYRGVGGQIFERVKKKSTTADPLDETVTCLPLFEEAIQSLETLKRDNSISDFYNYGRSTNPNAWIEVPNTITPEHEDILEWDQKFRDFVSTLIAVDGELWRPCQSPVLCVRRIRSKWEVEATNKLPSIDKGDVNRFHFPLDQFEEAERFSILFGQRTNAGWLASDYRYDQSLVSDVDVASYDLKVAAAFVCRHIEEASVKSQVADNSRSWSKAKTWDHYPTEMFEHYLTIRKALEAEGELGSAAGDKLADAIQGTMTLSMKPGMRWLLPFKTELTDHIEKWAQRPVEFTNGFHANSNSSSKDRQP
jgi:hypothetical protein